MLFRDLIVQNLPGEHTLATTLRVDLKQQYPREIAPLNNWGESATLWNLQTVRLSSLPE